LSFGIQKPRSVLDVGCGDGTYLRYLPESVQRAGYEPSAAGQKSLAAMGLKFFDIDSSGLETTHFDLVTMWQSLEHVDQPDALLQKVKPLLGTNGELFVSVPNFASLQSKVYRTHWNHLDPTRHLFHYTQETLFRLLERNGFAIESVTTFSFEYGVFGWWQSFFNLLSIDFNMAYKILKRRKSYPKTFQHTKALALHALLGLPMAVLALGLAFIDSMFARGAVIQVRARVIK
jgi:2-polyprenyl-3-methyl-5-hydroxy-6-metoxy-1,4-benzoquinol methylase